MLPTKRVKTADEQFFETEFTADVAQRRRLYAEIVEARRRHPEIVGASDAIDLSALFDDWTDPVYIDLYHLSEPADAAVADAMLPAIAAVLLRPSAGLTGGVASAAIPGLGEAENPEPMNTQIFR